MRPSEKLARDGARAGGGPLRRRLGRRGGRYEEEILASVREAEARGGGGRRELLLPVLPAAAVVACGEVERACDPVADMPSQCVLANTLARADRADPGLCAVCARPGLDAL